MQYRIAFKVKVKHWNCAHYCSERGARAAIMQAFSMRDFNFKSNSIVIFLYVLENLSSFNQVFFPRCMHFFSQKYAIFLKNMQFFSKICNFSQKYAIFSQKICIGKCLKFSYTYKKNAIYISNILFLKEKMFMSYREHTKIPWKITLNSCFSLLQQEFLIPFCHQLLDWFIWLDAWLLRKDITLVNIFQIKIK